MPEYLPMHHIDTSIIIESEKTLDGRFCTKYLQKLDYNYGGKLSLPALGEIMISLLMMKDRNKQYAILDFISNLRKIRKVGIYTPKDLSDISRKVKGLDTRIRLTDADIVACAIEDGANNLVTLDKNLTAMPSLR